MRVFINCRTRALQRTLEGYLGEFLSSEGECDFVISDFISEEGGSGADSSEGEEAGAPICLVGFGEEVDIRRPICRKSLFSELSRFYESLQNAPKSARNVLDKNELESLKRSLDSINGVVEEVAKKAAERAARDLGGNSSGISGVDSGADSSTTAPVKNAVKSPQNDPLREEIDTIMRDFADKIYRAIKNNA